MKTTRTGNRRRAGFTLIELMVAMVIMSVGLFAVIHMMVVSSRASAYSQERSTALQIAHAAAHELRARSRAWWRDPRLPPYNGFAAAFPDLAPLTADPLLGDLAPVGMAPIGFFGGDLAPGLGTQISVLGSTNLIDAFAINQWGNSHDMLGNVIDAEGSVYRLHFIAHQFDRRPDSFAGIPVRNWDLVRVLVVVSWDNKDQGEQNYSWTAWDTDANFWRRHMVTVPVFLRPAKYPINP